MGMEDLKNILDEFEEGVRNRRAKMHINTFEEVFKPVFEGRVSDNPRLIDKWVELAGDEYSPVDLVGDDGEVVAVVSGILKPIEGDSREGYKEVLARYEEATSILRINPVKSKALEDSVNERIEQGMLPSNAKSREYIKYINKEEDKNDDDLYSF